LQKSIGQYSSSCISAQVFFTHEVRMKRQANPQLSASGELAPAQYEQALREQDNLIPASIRKYLSDLRHFIAWYEACAAERAPDTLVNSRFDLLAITTPTLNRYRTYFQTVQRQKPASVNRSPVSLKRYCSWAIQLRYDQVRLDKRSGLLEVIGKRNTYREVPLNATASKVLKEYLPTLPADVVIAFPSAKRKKPLSERALGYIVKKYASVAKLPDVSPHDLRHRFGYRMAESVPLHRQVQIMGHDSLDTTKLYIQGTRHDVQQAVETIAWT
jgi:Phage integrase family